MHRKTIFSLLAQILIFVLTMSACSKRGQVSTPPEETIPQETIAPAISEFPVVPAVEEASGVETPEEEPIPSAPMEEAPVAGRKLSLEDQQFLSENGYLTHHSEVSADGLSWQFDTATATLYINGTGPMKDYYYDDPEWAIHKDSAKTVVLSAGITTVGGYAFYDFMQLTAVTLPDTVEYIGVAAFANAYQLTDFAFPAGLKEIGQDAFMEVKFHKPLVLPNGVELIGSYAFHANDFWDSVTIPASVYYIAEEAFSNCLHLHDFFVDPANEFYTAIDGVLYDKSVSVLLAYPPLKETENFAIPATVTRIANNAFDINFFAKTLSIPQSVTEVGAYQFGLLRQMEEYKVEDGNQLFKAHMGALLSKDGKTFYAYPVLSPNQEYTIPEGVENIEFRAFCEAWYLKKLYVPEGVRTLGPAALQMMNGTEIYLPESFPDTIEAIDKTSLYSNADGWDLASGFTYLPNDYNGVAAKGGANPAPMTIHYAGSQTKWDSFVANNELWLGDTRVICGS